jgi:glycosyltransferase involved in cell wall biosynthesis
LDLLQNPRKAEDMAKAARRLVCEEYSWDSRARMYEELYLRVKQERIGRPGPSPDQ